MSCTHLLRNAPGGCPVCRALPVPEPTPEQRQIAMALLREDPDAAARAASVPGGVEVVHHMAHVPDGMFGSLIDADEVDEEPEEYDLYDLDREACLRSLAEMVRMAFNQQGVRPGVDLEWGFHVEAICWHVQQQLEDRARALEDKTFEMRAQNLLVNVPPRSLKTICLTIATAWAWLRWPTIKIMYLSANPRVAQDSARMFRDLVTGEWFQRTFRPDWELRGDQEALSDLGNTAGGTRAARGLDATVTGAGSDWLLIDDPHDVRDTVSMVRTTVKGYASAVHNRINDPRCSIRTYIMQKVTRGDLSDYLLGITGLEE